eukprot:TRINITY_DN5430_c0_g1_i4.p1 TRINITY_DN5430_c0_g1~~TRINITY_DN5430_c0_g1_i4.p1  ORF type:complete len:623 (+),score=100.58 TRINITY_DN5430_c0_g1_i4:108-1976(+)
MDAINHCVLLFLFLFALMLAECGAQGNSRLYAASAESATRLYDSRLETPTNFIICLVPAHHDDLQIAFRQYSSRTPTSDTPPMAADDAIALVRPAPQSVARVQSWLSTLSSNFDLTVGDLEVNCITITCSYLVAEVVFQTRFGIVRSSTSNSHRPLIRQIADSFVPSAVRDDILCVWGLVDDMLSSNQNVAKLQLNTAIGVVPNSVRALYKLPKRTMSDKHSIGVALFPEYTNEGDWRYDDLQAFAALAAQSFPAYNDIRLKGPFPNGPSGYLQTIATEYAFALTDGAAAPHYLRFSADGEFAWANFAQYLQSADELPTVLVVLAAMPEIVRNKPFYDMIDQAFQVAALRGVSIIVPAGNYGCGSSICQSPPQNPGTAVPHWPASSPYVTSVGATMTKRATNTFCPPIPNLSRCGSDASTCHGWFCGQTSNTCVNTTTGPPLALQTGTDESSTVTTGGGFSSVYSVPLYQLGDVNKYLEKGLPFPPHVHATGKRGYPDVSAIGLGYLGCIAAQSPHEHLKTAIASSGTHMSAVTFGVLVTYLNDVRMQRGLPSVGFVNSFLYTLPDHAFIDVEEGNNASCFLDFTQCPCEVGFSASAGWDPLTGKGEVDFQGACEILTGAPC